MRRARHQRTNSAARTSVRARAKPRIGNAVTGAQRSTRGSQAPSRRKHATWTSNRARSSRTISSVICRSVPPGWKPVMNTATGTCGGSFTTWHLSKRSATG
ncbi:MAG: hypothetical protein DMF85_14015 [Acidobacteria bacterium]|nr:MAG: hypothetical protein DMF85_14015 [Acidobacteriota bacterium]